MKRIDQFVALGYFILAGIVLGLMLSVSLSCSRPTVYTGSHPTGALWCLTLDTRKGPVLGCSATLPLCEHGRQRAKDYGAVLGVEAVSRCRLATVSR